MRPFADDSIIYRKIKNNNDKEMLQIDLNRLGKWAVENAMKINRNKSKAVCFTKARVFFFYLGCEAIGTAATPGLLCQPRVISEIYFYMPIYPQYMSSKQSIKQLKTT
jgi:hypothetical protein